MANLIENLSYETRAKLIEIEEFDIEPEIFVEINESIQTEILQLLSSKFNSKNYKKIVSDNAISIIENLNQEKNSVLDKLPPKDRFLLEEGLSYPENQQLELCKENLYAKICQVIGLLAKQ